MGEGVGRDRIREKEVDVVQVKFDLGQDLYKDGSGYGEKQLELKQIVMIIC